MRPVNNQLPLLEGSPTMETQPSTPEALQTGSWLDHFPPSLPQKEETHCRKFILNSTWSRITSCERLSRAQTTLTHTHTHTHTPHTLHRLWTTIRQALNSYRVFSFEHHGRCGCVGRWRRERDHFDSKLKRNNLDDQTLTASTLQLSVFRPTQL